MPLPSPPQCADETQAKQNERYEQWGPPVHQTGGHVG